MCWSVKLEQSFVMHLSHNVESVLEYKPSTSISLIIISLPSHHNFWNLISSMTYPLLSALDCRNFEGRGCCFMPPTLFHKMLMQLWYCICLTMHQLTTRTYNSCSKARVCCLVNIRDWWLHHSALSSAVLGKFMKFNYWDFKWEFNTKDAADAMTWDKTWEFWWTWTIFSLCNWTDVS